MIRLRAIEESDLEQMRDWRNTPEIRDRCREYRMLNMLNQKTWFAQSEHDHRTLMYGIEHHENGFPEKAKLIGVCGLTNIHWVNRTAELSFYIGDENNQRKGYGTEAVNALLTEAFERLNLNRVWLEVYEFNHAGIALFVRCGFKLEGNMRSHVWRPTTKTYCESSIMGILAREWRKLHG